MIECLGYRTPLRKVENNIEKQVNLLGGDDACHEEIGALYFRIKTTGFLIDFFISVVVI
jgi:hypothetical protein